MSFSHYDLDINPPHSDLVHGNGIQASSNNRCPLCDKPDWCFVLDNGNAVVCGRTDVAPEDWQQTGIAKDGRPIYTKAGSRQSGHKHKGILPNPNDITLKVSPKTDFPQWIEIGSDYHGAKELQMEFLYPDSVTGEPVGKVVRKQWEDKRLAYNNGKKTKHFHPHHWAEPYYPDQGSQGWWSDRGKGLKPWPLYREAEVRDAITSGKCNILFHGTGEQAVESYRRLGLYAVCVQGGEGTGNAQLIDFLKQNTPQVFVIQPDEDEAGHKASAKLQKGCDRAKLPTVTINLKRIWSELPPKGDITNILNESGMSESEIVKRLEAEIRRAIAERLEQNRKLNDPDERLRLELLELLNTSDLISKERRKIEICRCHGLKERTVDKLLKDLERQTKTAESRCLGLDELFDLPQTGIDYLIPGMLPVGETVLVTANPKTGKTLLAYDAGFAVATGEDTFLGETTKRGKVLIIQTDESLGTAKGRLSKRGFRREDAPNVRFMDSFDMTQLAELEKHLEDFRPSLVIIDSLRRISAGRGVSENSSEFADLIYTLKELLTRYGASGLLIHHSNKDREAVGVNRVRGSSAIAGAVWGVWQLDHIPKPDPNHKNKLIIDPKDPNRILSVIARDVEGQRLKVELDPENNHWINHGEEGVSKEEVQGGKTQETRVIGLLKSVAPLGLEGQEINEELEIGRGLYSVLNRLLGKRIISSRPSTVDRRRTVYFYPCGNEENSGDSHSPEGSQNLITNQTQRGGEGDNSSSVPEKKGDTLPPLPCVSDVIKSPKTITMQGLEDRSQNRSQPITDSQNRSQLPSHELDGSEPVVTQSLKVGNRVEIIMDGSSYQAQTGTVRRVFQSQRGVTLYKVQPDGTDRRIDYQRSDLKLAQ